MRIWLDLLIAGVTAMAIVIFFFLVKLAIADEGLIIHTPYRL